MSIYTGRGDSGDTSLADGTRVPKDDARVEAYGAVDELTSAVAFARAVVTDRLLDDVLGFLLQRLLNCSSSLAVPSGGSMRSTPGIAPEDVTVLERAIDRFETQTGRLERFIIGGVGDAATRLHLARTVARRAERRIVTLARDTDIDPQVLAFVNRSSDLLFAAARYADLTGGHAEEQWDPHATRPAV